jgi:hypothetical protein
MMTSTNVDVVAGFVFPRIGGNDWNFGGFVESFAGHMGLTSRKGGGTRKRKGEIVVVD